MIGQRKYQLAGSGGGEPHAQGTSTGTAVVVALTVPPRSTIVYLQADTNDCYVVFDGGTAPSATRGMKVEFDQAPFPVIFGDANVVRFASAVAGNSTLRATFYE